MRSCLKLSGALRTTGLVFAFAGLASASALADRVATRIKTVVRADSRGRLVRAVIVTPQAAADPDSFPASVAELVEAAAKRHEVDPLLVHSLIQVESNYSRYAISPKGARGLMQLMPDTARRFGVRDIFDPGENIEGGVRYLKYLQSLFPGDRHLALAAYNAGEGAVWKYGNKIPPYRETQEYVARVNTRYVQALQSASRRPKSSAEPAQGAQPAESQQEVFASVHAFIDPEGRLHLRNADTSAVKAAAATP